MSKAGMVTQIRVNPEDCQSILDLMGILNIDPYDGRSFAQCTSIAISSMLGSFRKQGIIPQVDPFQWINRMGPFIDSRNNKKKSAMADALYNSGGRNIASVELPQTKVIHPGQYIPRHIQGTNQGSGFVESGPTDSAAQKMPMDEGMRELLSEEMQALYDKGALTTEEQARLTELNNLLYS